MPSRAETEQMDNNQFAQRLDEYHDNTSRPDDEPNPITRRVLRKWNKQSLADFEATLDSLKARGW